ncbi:MAG: hypothetical protein KJ726_11740 [Verrucomicrobia bacterium]|nr:hypothetical protein [Verrucomicrobiota bacterium]MBU1910709.1 hypothetical protein [Verrucomicrobiota bacterium]
MNPPRQLNGLVWAGLLGTLILGGYLVANLVELYRGDPGYNWTHRDMRLALPETRDALELYIGGELLQKHLERKGLTATGPDGTPYPVVEQDIRVRLNYWAERRADLAVRAIPGALLTGISLACLALGLYQVRQQRKKS